MAAKTRFGLEGYGVRRAGSFSGKTIPSTHPVGRITRFGLEGYGVRRAGSFASKSPSTTAQIHQRLFIANVGRVMIVSDV